MKTRIMLNKLAKRFPKRIAKDNHDFVGLMTGKMPEEVHKILLALDMDQVLLPEVERIRPDVVMTHHPFIYGTKYRVFKRDLQKKELSDKMDSMNIPVYSFHTNFDTGRGGINDSLVELLGLVNIYAPIKNPMMRIGELKNEMPIEEFATFAKQKFNVDYSLLVNGGKKTVKKIAIIAGGGSRYWPLAKEEGADIYISGDAPHYVRRDIINNEYNYLDMPHEIEKIFMTSMKKILLEMDPTLEIITVDHETLPKVI